TGGGRSKRYFSRKHDIILLYTKGKTWTFNVDAVRVPYKDTSGYAKSGIVAKSGKRYTPHPDGTPVDSVWDIPIINPMAKERTGYPTQKPLALLERIIKASSHESDLVFDPFCGCATTLVAADRLRREWAGVDLSPLAIKLVDERIAKDRGLWGGVTALTEPPRRTDLGDPPNYRTHRHRLYGEQEGICTGCDTHFPFRVMEVDYVLPRSKGGTDHPDNLQLLCSGCNRSKGAAPGPNGGLCRTKPTHTATNEQAIFRDGASDI
ncbi:MAG: HNH endonuclease, partial [Hyphomonadaceae bacterium]|nr:HNH endonuclease [Hyphomonadaceae bacterium]